MLHRKSLFLFTLTFLIATSCKKDDAKPTPDIKGVWAGTSLYLGTHPISLRLILSNNNLVTADQAPDNPQTTAAGSYAFEGDLVVVRALSNFDGHVYYHKMGLSNSNTRMDGYYYDESNRPNGGTLSLTKQ